MTRSTRSSSMPFRTAGAGGVGHPQRRPAARWWPLDAGRAVWGRPVGVTVAKDGDSIVTDDGGNRIWRVTYPLGSGGT
jgi:hypothetical protein